MFRFQFDLLVEKAILKNLGDVKVREISSDMAEIERENFSPGFSQPSYDIEDDFGQNGFFGMGIFGDDDKIKGYIYGYQMTEDEYSDLEEIDFDSVTVYNEKYRKYLESPDSIRAEVNPNVTFYVSNFVVEKRHRLYVYKLLKDFIQGLRQNGIKYITFDALKDTQNLFLTSDGQVKRDRVEKAGLDPIGSFDTGYSKLSIFRI